MKKSHAFAASFLAVSLALSAGAAFMPSVEYKEAPQIVEKVDESGNVAVGEIRDESGEVVATVAVGTVTVTPLSTVKTTAPSDKTQSGATASDAVQKVDEETVERLKAVETEIAAEFEKPTESTLIQEIAKDLNDAPAENIVVSDVFSITVTAEIEETLKNGATLSVAVVSQNITKEDEKKVTIYQKDADTGEWKKVPFEIMDDGVIVLELESAGEVVIFRDNEAAPVTEENAPVSPSTGGDRPKKTSLVIKT